MLGKASCRVKWPGDRFFFRSFKNDHRGLSNIKLHTEKIITDLADSRKSQHIRWGLNSNNKCFFFTLTSVCNESAMWSKIKQLCGFFWGGGNGNLQSVTDSSWDQQGKEEGAEELHYCLCI